MATTRLTTVEELERDGTPEGRYELIDGELIEMSPAGGDASFVGNTISFFLTGHVRSRGLGRVYNAEGGFVLFPSRALVRAADVAFVRADRLPSKEEHRRLLRLAPDLVVEVISPSDRMDDVLAKVETWLAAGVRLLWLVDPDRRTVAVYEPGREPRALGEGDELDGGEVLPDFRVAVAELFA